MINARMTFHQKVVALHLELVKTGVPTQRDVERVLRQLFADIAEEALHGRRITFPDFGAFVKKTRRARRVRNPVTRELMELPRSVSVGFRCSGAIKR